MSGGATMSGRMSTIGRRGALAATLAGLGLGLCSCVSLFPKSQPVQLYAFGQLPPPSAIRF